MSVFKKVHLKKTKESVFVRSPYEKAFVEGARALKGTYRDDWWIFDADQEEKVVELCERVYEEKVVAPKLITVELEALKDDVEMPQVEASTYTLPLGYQRKLFKVTDGELIPQEGVTYTGEAYTKTELRGTPLKMMGKREVVVKLFKKGAKVTVQDVEEECVKAYIDEHAKKEEWKVTFL